MEEFLAEASRILKPGGLLFVTTDYWEDEIEVGAEVRTFGQPWMIFCRKYVEGIIKRSTDFGFGLYEEAMIPSCAEKCAVWNGKEFTFICMVFKKEQ